ncbi:MAG TPA: amidohydrolase/deacetylase family metallohydrolase [Caldilineaceae bacterium]|nr:amidohydrolase/deacetylase family metallohydrolase [Caldilineaceae bacterium]
MSDLVIRNGTVIDPVVGLHAPRDVVVQDGHIAALLEPASAEAATAATTATEVVDATGLLVVPGMIDVHVHIFSSFSHYGVDVDPSCLARGVTTVLDAGSAGAQTYPAFKRYVIDVSDTRVFALLNISNIGMVPGAETDPAIGELDHLPFLNVPAALDCIEANRDTILGIKIRLSRNLAADGRNEPQALDLALEAAAAARLPIMVHFANSSVPIDDLLPRLRPGDLLTHCYHPHESGILDRQGQVYRSVWDAIDRGVLLDVGHGRGAFSWAVARAAMRQDIWPHTISSDLHQYNIQGPVFDLATTVSKLLHLGMPLLEAIRRVTATPAQVLGMAGQIGTLQPGAEADIALLELAEGDFALTDITGAVEQAGQTLIPRGVYRAGKPYTGPTTQYTEHNPPWYHGRFSYPPVQPPHFGHTHQ